jgi:flagellar motor protein MotB
MGVNQKMIRTVLLAAFFLAGAGCSHHHYAIYAEESSSEAFPEQIYVYPNVNDYKHSRVGVFGFSEPSYACGTGRVAAEAVCDDLLQKGVFSNIINEAKQGYIGTEDSLALARSRGYDLIITGDVLYYFEGSEVNPSKVDERIRVRHVPTERILWSATANSLASPPPSTDYLLFQLKGGSAKPASSLIKTNASKFSNMLLKQPRQRRSAKGSTDILLSSQKARFDKLQKEVEAKQAENDLLTQQLFKEVEESKILEEKVDVLSVQADQLEKHLKEEIERGEITLKRHKTKTIINIDNSICFDSGSAVLKKDVKKTLSKISNTLSNFPENNIQVEGHTDDVPIRSRQFPSNWELSSARALAVLGLLLQKSDIEPGRLSAAGYGEYHPIVPNDSSENRRLNRRVDIVIVPGST